MIVGQGKYIAPTELASKLQQNFDLSRYNSVRLVSCYSGSGTNSFGSKLSKALGGKLVKSYVGQVTANHRPDSYAPLLKSLASQSIKDTAYHTISKTNPYSVFSNPRKWWNFSYRPVYFGR